MKYTPTIGLEIHAELKTQTKMFCNSKNDPDEKRPNVNICPVCMGHPGTLPVINREAVKHVLKIGVAVGGILADYTRFDRKNYFYPDIPKGYQISQYQLPLVSGGTLANVELERVHLEEDTGRSSHTSTALSAGDVGGYSLIDFNRAGLPLMELVTKPVIKSAEEASFFAKELQLLLRYLGASDANMEKGEMRVEANVSVRSNEARIKPNEDRIILKDESYQIMGLLFKIHSELGSIYKEKNYQDALESLLKKEGIHYEREKEIPIKMAGEKVSSTYADFVIGGKILLELKARKDISQEDIRQTLKYIKSSGLPLGILVNFRAQKLYSKRLINPLFAPNLSVFGGNLGTKLGTKVEVKNLNSFKAVEKAIQFEISRQVELLERDEKIIQETRGWDENKEKTFSQRVKESSHDYRYFPEPDLPHLRLSEIPEFNRGSIKKEIPELPWEKRERVKKILSLNSDAAEMLVGDTELGLFFDAVAGILGNDVSSVKILANYLTSDLVSLINASGIRDWRKSIDESRFAELISMIKKDVISSRAAKDILSMMFSGDTRLPSEIAEKEKLFQQNDSNELQKIIQEAIEENKEVFQEYKNGKEQSLQYLIGQVMKKTRGAANPKVVSDAIKKLRS